jgi:hypothetical protein
MTFLFYGFLPVSILVYLMGAPERRRRRQRQEAAASELLREAKDHD